MVRPLNGGGLGSRPVIGAVVLAAGAGARIGRRPKCLLELGGVPLIRRTLTALAAAGIDEVVVVLGHHADAIGPLVDAFPVTVVRNPRPDDGPVSSQRLGLAALSGEIDAAMVVLADQPLLAAEDFVTLLGAWQERAPGIDVVFPEVDGQRGNPVVFSADVRDRILAADAAVGCRQWQGRHPDRVMAFTTDNRRYRVDIDTGDDMARFERETGLALRWPEESAS